MREFQMPLLLFLALCSSETYTQNVQDDWKVCGFSNVPKAVGVFYLQNEIKRLPSGNVQVWTKALSVSKLQKASDAVRENDEVFKRVVKKVAANYVPPIGQVKSLNKAQALDMIGFEVIADTGTIQPVARILWEIDCAQELYRTLSVITDTGKSSSQASAWDHVPPESTIRSLKTLTCPVT